MEAVAGPGGPPGADEGDGLASFDGPGEFGTGPGRLARRVGAPPAVDAAPYEKARGPPVAPTGAQALHDDGRRSGAQSGQHGRRQHTGGHEEDRTGVGGSWMGGHPVDGGLKLSQVQGVGMSQYDGGGHTGEVDHPGQDEQGEPLLGGLSGEGGQKGGHSRARP